MLTNLLPGFRDLRTPLAIGYIWLVAVWLALESVFRTASHATGFLGRVHDLTTLAGKGATVTAVSFLAYLVGSFLEIDPQSRIGEVLHPLFRFKSPKIDIVTPDVLNRISRIDLGSFSVEFDAATATSTDKNDSREQEGISRAERPRTRDLQPESVWLSDMGFVDSPQIIRQVATLLQVRQPPIYDRYDRLTAEAALRLNVAISLLGLLAVLSWETNPFWLLIMPALFLLARQGFTKLVQARNTVIEALWILDLTEDIPVPPPK